MIKNLLKISTLLSSLLILNSCSKTEKLSGCWKQNDIVFSLEKDGTLTTNSSLGNGTWKLIDDDRLNFEYSDGSNHIHTIVKEKDDLMIIKYNGVVEFRWTRIKCEDFENPSKDISNQDKMEPTEIKEETSMNNNVTMNEITGYPNEIYNPQPLSDNPSIGVIKCTIREIDGLYSSDGSIRFPMNIAKIQTVLKVNPVIEIDDYFDTTDYSWTLPSGIVISAFNTQKTNSGLITGGLCIEGKNATTVSGLPFGLVINQSKIKDVENQLLGIKTQKMGNSIEFRKGTEDYEFVFNKNKTLEKVFISGN